jgi:hypothetical protein
VFAEMSGGGNPLRTSFGASLRQSEYTDSITVSAFDSQKRIFFFFFFFFSVFGFRWRIAHGIVGLGFAKYFH